jgi:hypothetical protein
MSRSGLKIGALFLLQLAVGLFFLIVGLEVLIYYNSAAGQLEGLSRLFGSATYVIQIIIGVIELVSGIVILGALFLPVQFSMLNIAVLVVFILWIVRIIFVYFVSRRVFDPTVLTWLREVALDIIVLIGIWIVRERYAD